MPSARLKTVLEFLKIEHSLFALPFVLIGMLMGFEVTGRDLLSREGAVTFALVLLAAVSARTLAMTLNRIVDREIDARNPRTANRALPAGEMRMGTAYAIAGASLLVMGASAGALNWLCLALSPALVGLFFLYPYAKRFTWGCHFVLGMAFVAAPGGGYYAVTGSLAGTWPHILIGLAAGFWVAGFDVIYALLDVDFDRKAGIHSIPARFGVERAKGIAAGLHALTVLALAGLGLALGYTWPYWVGVALVGGLLAYEHALARKGDAGSINKAFFNVNAGLGWIVLAGLASALVL